MQQRPAARFLRSRAYRRKCRRINRRVIGYTVNGWREVIGGGPLHPVKRSRRRARAITMQQIPIDDARST